MKRVRRGKTSLVDISKFWDFGYLINQERKQIVNIYKTICVSIYLYITNI